MVLGESDDVINEGHTNERKDQVNDLSTSELVRDNEKVAPLSDKSRTELAGVSSGATPSKTVTAEDTSLNNLYDVDAPEEQDDTETTAESKSLISSIVIRKKDHVSKERTALQEAPVVKTKSPSSNSKRRTDSGGTSQKISARPDEQMRLSQGQYPSHKFYDQFSEACKERFHFLSRYHVGDTMPAFQRNKLRIELRKRKIDHINIGLFGLPASGKSALLNTIYYTMTGNYYEYSAERKSQSQKRSSSVTDRRVELRLTETITMFDNRGIENEEEAIWETRNQCG